MCSRYSSSVVAPTSRSSPRASMGLSMLPASIADSPVAPAPTTVCSSSMKVTTSPVGALDLLQDGLQPLLELAAVLRPGDHRAEVERHQALAAQALGDVARHHALGQPLDDGGLADAGLADEHGVVLGAAREHLHDPADLGVTADHRVEPAVPRELREVVAVLRQRVVGALRVGAGDPAAPPDAGQRGEQRAFVAPALVSAPAAPGPFGRLPSCGETDEQVLGRDVLVAELPRDVTGGGQGG